jgi:hypothetical protein
VTFIVQTSFKAKSGEIKKGQVIAVPEDKAQALVRSGKIAELRNCHICGEYAWWLSAHGALACGVCHPPAPGAGKKWIGDPEALNKLKTGKSAATCKQGRTSQAGSDKDVREKGRIIIQRLQHQ